MIRFNIITISMLLFLSCTSAYSQDTLLNKYGLWVISSTEVYKKTTDVNFAKTMIAVNEDIPDAVFDLKYADTNNFMHTKLYPPLKTTYLRMSASMLLTGVQSELKKQNLGIKIWDAYRPYSVTEKMWEKVKDERYAADPKTGSGHNRGIAVDLTIIDLTTKKELDMGTGFDNFSDTAHHDFKNLPTTVLKNRTLLRSVMEKHGFKALETEWWHYYLPDTKDYELLDISFEELSKMQ